MAFNPGGVSAASTQTYVDLNATVAEVVDPKFWLPALADNTVTENDVLFCLTGNGVAVVKIATYDPNAGTATLVQF